MGRKPGVKAASKKAATPKKRASKSTTPNPETLAGLSPDRLIRLILEEVEQNLAFKKRVSAAIAGLQGPDAVAALVDRRLAALEKARGFIDWQKRKSFAADLDATLATIVTDLKPLDAGMALERLLRFLAGAEGTLERVDDSSGQVHAIYEDAAEAAASLVAGLPPAEAARTAKTLLPMLDRDGFGLIEGLLHNLVPSLKPDDLSDLDAGIVETIAALPKTKPEARKTVYGADAGFETRMARIRLTRLRQAITDARGDVDAFLALEKEVAPERPDGAAVAERLLAAGRAEEALDWIRKPAKRGLVVVTREQMASGAIDLDAPDRRRQAVEIRILDALGRRDEAQGLRWARFERGLDPEALREYLAKLPDFEDEEALERAFAVATGGKDPLGGLYFLIRWPHLDRAARLVLDRRAEWDGRDWTWLVPCAEALEADHPLAASLLYRALLYDILGRARSPAYGHGARQLAKLEDLARRLEPGDLVPDHATYRAALRKAHGRKAAFWAQVED